MDYLPQRATGTNQKEKDCQKKKEF